MKKGKAKPRRPRLSVQFVQEVEERIEYDLIAPKGYDIINIGGSWDKGVPFGLKCVALVKEADCDG